MDLEYVSIAKSRAGSAGIPSRAEEPTPKTSDTLSAKTNPGGKSASKSEEG